MSCGTPTSLSEFSQLMDQFSSGDVTSGLQIRAEIDLRKLPADVFKIRLDSRFLYAYFRGSIGPRNARQGAPPVLASMASPILFPEPLRLVGRTEDLRPSTVFEHDLVSALEDLEGLRE